MTRKDAILGGLPVLAGVLGRAYGITVEIGGTDAYTDGTTIRLPGLPSQMDETFLGLVRGYIDHEAAHIRHTDFEHLRSESISPLTRHIWNIFEDWRVENRLAALYPGCRANFLWLIRHMFLGKEEGAFPILSWLLLSVRAWSVPDLNIQVRALADRIDADHPGLRPKLEAILSAMAADCPDTAATLAYARQVVECLKGESRIGIRHPLKSPEFEAKTSTETGPNERKSPSVQNALQTLIDAGTDQLPSDMGEDIRTTLRSVSTSAACDSMAVEGRKTVSALSSERIATCRTASVGLRNRFDGLLQSTRRVGVRSARRGRLGTRLLHRVAVKDPRLFLQREEKPTVNTALHILLDASGSMRSRMDLAAEACYALALALHQARINVGITAFPGESRIGTQIPTVAPILRHGQRPTADIHPHPSGGTPLGEALWWLVPHMQGLSENRKVVLIVTDGDPYDPAMVRRAVDAGRALGIEFIGLGIAAPAVTDLLPGASGTIDSLDDLLPVLFEAVQGVVVPLMR